MTRDEELRSRAEYLKKELLNMMHYKPNFHWTKKGNYEAKTEQLINNLVWICLTDKGETQWKNIKESLSELYSIATSEGMGYNGSRASDFSSWIKENYYPKSSNLGCATFFKVVGVIGALIAAYHFGKSSEQPSPPPQPTPMVEKGIVTPATNQQLTK